MNHQASIECMTSGGSTDQINIIGAVTWTMAEAEALLNSRRNDLKQGRQALNVVRFLRNFDIVRATVTFHQGISLLKYCEAL